MLLLGCSIAFVACDNDNKQEMKDIRLGADDINEVSLNKLSTRTIILSGGTGKYTANVADSKIAGVNISKDTLRINGIWEGRTYATIISGDFKKRVEINVVVPELSISQSEIRLYPRDESKFVSLNGGGDIVDLKIEDPDKVMNAKWNAKTSILEIQAYYEGEAKIRIISQDKKEKTLKALRRYGRSSGDLRHHLAQPLRADEHGDGRATPRCGSMALQRCTPLFFPKSLEDNARRGQSRSRNPHRRFVLDALSRRVCQQRIERRTAQTICRRSKRKRRCTSWPRF